MIETAAISATANDAAKVCSHHPPQLYQLQMHQPEPGCKCGKLRPPRKVHALVGFWLAAFVTVHLAICLTGTNPRLYQGTVDLLRQRLGHLPGAVLLLIALPLLLQAVSGSYLVGKEGMKYDIKRCDRGGKLRFLLQRFSGLAILAFLLVHLGSMFGWGSAFASQEIVAHLLKGGLPEGNAFSYTAAAFQPWTSPVANLFTIVFLLMGILGTAFHAANGALSGAILFKVVESPLGKIRFEQVCAVVGITLAVMGTVAWYAFTLSPNVHAALTASAH